MDVRCRTYLYEGLWFNNSRRQLNETGPGVGSRRGTRIAANPATDKAQSCSRSRSISPQARVSAVSAKAGKKKKHSYVLCC